MGVACAKCIDKPPVAVDNEPFVVLQGGLKEAVIPSQNGSDAPKRDPSAISFWVTGSYDYDKTTEDQYAVKHFTGLNKDIRPLLDYTYHKKYSEDRVVLQDKLLEETAKQGKQQDDLLLPWVIFTAGAMGAGKGYVIKWLEKQGCLPLSQFVIVDPDAIRQSLPEWDGYVKKDPMTAAVKTQKEAGMMAEVLGYKALRERWNVIFDGSLRDVEWYKVYFAKLRAQYPGIRLMILHIQADREEVLARAEKRGKETGRMVPKALLESSMDAVPKSVYQLAPFVDVAIRVNNKTGKDPEMSVEDRAVTPKKGTVLTPQYLSRLWKPLDTDGDGQLSKEEVQAALACGVLTQEILNTIDMDHDGSISKEELRTAKQKAYDASTKGYA